MTPDGPHLPPRKPLKLHGPRIDPARLHGTPANGGPTGLGDRVAELELLVQALDQTDTITPNGLIVNPDGTITNPANAVAPTSFSETFTADDAASNWTQDRGLAPFTITPGTGIATGATTDEADILTGGPKLQNMTLTVATVAAAGFGNSAGQVGLAGLIARVSPSVFLIGQCQTSAGNPFAIIFKCVAGVYTVLAQQNVNPNAGPANWITLSKLGARVSLGIFDRDPAGLGARLLTSVGVTLNTADTTRFAPAGYAGVATGPSTGAGAGGPISLMRIS